MMLTRWLVIAFLAGMPLAAIGMPSDSSNAESPPVPWDVSLSGYYYVIPDEDDFLIAVGSADRGNLHLEARYNYEDLKTGSLFAGWKISTGEEFTAEFTPMLGAAVGRTMGVIPALEISLAYGIFDLYDESEYLVDLQDEGSSYFYSWLELGITPVDMLRFGVTAQRLRAAETPLEVERGLFMQMMPEHATVGLYAFNLASDYWFFIFSFGIAL
jgi:hypothetical protein